MCLTKLDQGFRQCPALKTVKGVLTFSFKKTEGRKEGRNNNCF